MTHKYYVKTQDGTLGFLTFPEALAAYNEYQPAIIFGDDCDYATDTGWFDGLTDEERDQL